MQKSKCCNRRRVVGSALLASLCAHALASGPSFQPIIQTGDELGDGWVAESIEYHRRGPALALGGSTRSKVDREILAPAVYYRSSDSSSFNSIWRKPPPTDIGPTKVRSYGFVDGLYVGSDRVAFFSRENEYDSSLGQGTSETFSTQVTTAGTHLISSQVDYYASWIGGENFYSQHGYSGHHLVAEDFNISNGQKITRVGLRSPGYSLVMEGVVNDTTGTGSFVSASKPDVEAGDFLVFSFGQYPGRTTIYRWHEGSLDVWRDSPYTFRGSYSLNVDMAGQMSRGRLIGVAKATLVDDGEPGMSVFGEATATTFVPYAVYGEAIDGTSMKYVGGGSFIGEEGDLTVYTAHVSDSLEDFLSRVVLLGRWNGKSFVILEAGQELFGSHITRLHVREGSLYNNTITFSYDLADGRSGIAMMNVVPEPGTLAAIGLGALLLRRRKTNR
mgnify:CR=1 FL=1